jgi:phage repressor protein C with HTH and peptisase S24 domain
MKEWFTSEEISQLEGMPNTASNVTRKASKEGWKKRQRTKIKGVAFEYHRSSLPQSVIDSLENNEVREPSVAYLGDTIKIPVYDVTVSAGHGCILYEQDQANEYVAIQRELLSLYGVTNRRELFILPVKGDSMEPTLYEDDLVLIQRINLDSFLHEGVYVIRLKDDLFIKRIQYNHIKQTLKIKSDNKEYDEMFFSGDDLNDIEVIGEAVRVLMTRIRKVRL